MKYCTLIYLLLISTCSAMGQSNNIWTSFWNRDTTTIGFKDKNGVVKIKPRFKGITIASKFEYIIAVTEEIDSSWNNYYLTKNGRKVGRDSLHMFDNGADCESEGFIRFRDHKTDKAGMFNRQGDIAIPADYNELTSVHNGMVVAIKGATKKIDGEYFSWIGGEQLLIDTNNNVLINNFNYNENLHFFSLKISSQPNTDTIRQNFNAKNGQYYSFINFEKEFQQWLKESLLNNLSKANLLKSTFKKITFWKESNGWINEAKETFVSRNFALIKSKLLELKDANCDYNIFNDGLNPFIFNSADFNGFYNNCRESKNWIYPIKEIVITHKNNKDIKQDNLEFLRTDNGYKLLSVTIRQGNLK